MFFSLNAFGRERNTIMFFSDGEKSTTELCLMEKCTGAFGMVETKIA